MYNQKRKTNLTVQLEIRSWILNSAIFLLDPLQFVYKSHRGKDDAAQTLLDSVSILLIVDFSSTFNLMKVHILLKRLADLNVDTDLILWSFSPAALKGCVLMVLFQERLLYSQSSNKVALFHLFSLFHLFL